MARSRSVIHEEYGWFSGHLPKSDQEQDQFDHQGNRKRLESPKTLTCYKTSTSVCTIGYIWIVIMAQRRFALSCATERCSTTAARIRTDAMSAYASESEHRHLDRTYQNSAILLAEVTESSISSATVELRASSSGHSLSASNLDFLQP